VLAGVFPQLNGQGRETVKHATKKQIAALASAWRLANTSHTAGILARSCAVCLHNNIYLMVPVLLPTSFSLSNPLHVRIYRS
jgi:hypothetical protein